MKKTMLLGTLAAVLAASQASAGPIGSAQSSTLQGATITASYNAGAVLGADHGYAAEAGSGTTALDSAPDALEFLSGDYLFGFDFTDDGTLTVYANDTIAPGNYRFRFDFGSTLAAPLAAFTLLDASAIGGMPLLTVLDSHTIGLDLSSITWNSSFAAFTTQIALVDATDIPEPGAGALVLTGLMGVALTRRRRYWDARP
jgi:hypothetical protein